MKTTTAVAWMVAAMLGAGVTVGAKEGGGKGGGPGGQGGQQARPTPEQVAEHMFSKFDANKDGKLTQSELVAVLDALREHRKQRGGAEGQGAEKAAKHTPPATGDVATKMIEKFAADKTGLTQAEFAKALEQHRANRSQQGGGKQGGGQHGGGAGGSSK